jgi:hypothetical protein
MKEKLNMLSFMKEKVLLFVHGMVEAFAAATSFLTEKVKNVLNWGLETSLLATSVDEDSDFVAELEQEMELNRKHQGIK